MAGTDLLPRTPQEQDSVYNPADADYLLSPEHMAKEPEQYPDREKLNDAEKTPEAPAGDDINYDPSGGKKRQPIWSRLGKNKRVAIASFGALGGGGVILALFMGLLPLKLEALISNITDAASEVPGYAVEQRTEYLITRVLATRMLMMANGTSEDAGKVAFCKNSSISCSLFTTYTANYFEEMMDFDLSKTDSGMKLSVKANGRSRLGGSATNWEIQVSDKFDQKGIASTIKKIETNKEMRVFLKNRIDQKLSTKNVISRFVARKILMRKYGVTSWRGFEKTSNKIADIKSSLRAATYKNTIGKISPRFGAYLACFQGGTDTCDKLIESLSSDLSPGDPPKEGEADYDRKKAEYDKKMKQIESLRNLTAKLSGDIPSVPDAGVEKIIGKLFSSKIIAAATGVGAAISAVTLVDLGLSGVGAVESGAASLVKLDMNSQIFTGFAYGDSAGVATNWEKAKAGDFTDDVGGEVINELSTLVDCDGSPLCAYESGYIDTGSTVSAASNQVQRECPTENGYEMVTLSPGELVCPSYQLVPDYTKEFADNPTWKTAVAMNTAWVGIGAHGIVQIYNEVADRIITTLGDISRITQIFAGVAGFAKEKLQPIMEWIMGTIFNPAAAGYGVIASLNYDALSGAIHTEQWELMQNGVASDGTVLGGGGQYLTDEEANNIVVYQNIQDQEDFNDQSLFARLFDPSLKGSLVQLAAVRMPTTLSGLAKLPGKTLAALLALPSANAADTTQWQDFHLPQYGYKLNDPVLKADPSIYSESYCASTAQAREANKDKRDGSIIAVYWKSDPCALEKLAVGSAITDVNPSDPNAFSPIFSTFAVSTGSCPAGSTAVTDIKQGYWDGNYKAATFCAIENTSDASLSGLRDSDVFKEYNTILQTNATGKIVVLDSAAEDMVNLVKRYGSTLAATFSYRSHNQQCVMYYYTHNLGSLPGECSGLTKAQADEMRGKMSGNYVMPGSFYTSQHESGKAIDIVNLSWINQCVSGNYDGDDTRYKTGTCYNFVSAAIPNDDNHVVWKGE